MEIDLKKEIEESVWYSVLGEVVESVAKELEAIRNRISLLRTFGERDLKYKQKLYEVLDEYIGYLEAIEEICLKKALSITRER